MCVMDYQRVEVCRVTASTDDVQPTMQRVAGSSAVVWDVFHLGGALTEEATQQVIDQLLVDPLVQRARRATAPSPTTVDVALLAGVTDTAAETLLRAATLVGVEGLVAASTGTRYDFASHISPTTLAKLAGRELANPVIQRSMLGALLTPAFVAELPDDPAPVEVIAIRTCDEVALLAVSGARRLSLDGPEMLAIQRHFRDIGRDPTDVELEMLAQTWSEHCVHKTFRARIDYVEERADGSVNAEASETIDGLLGSYIRAATETLAKPWVRSAFVDDAGIIGFTETHDLAFKVETHNHPSALEPFGGANTGVGGVIRDVIGVSARPIAVTDVLCFGPQDLPDAVLPNGVLHPRTVAAGVIHGVEDYGNKMGIPNVSGTLIFDEGYTQNPLVYCGCLGILPRGSHPTEAQPGDLVVVIGGRTGRDGIRGATFSSMEMDASTALVSGSAVQIGHPVHEKQALEVILQARDERLYTKITDCGAGGLSSSVGEMAEGLGADIDLDAVPLKYQGLAAWEIWLSEAQERMVVAVPAQHWLRLKAIAEAIDIHCDVLGRFRGDGQLRITHRGAVVCDLPTSFLHDGIPQRQMTARWKAPHTANEGRYIPTEERLEALLQTKLARSGVDAKRAVVRRFDHEVQGATIVKPFGGADGETPNPAVVLVPREVRQTGGNAGVALSVGINIDVGKEDPYLMAWAAVYEARVRVLAVGADPDRIAILDNFCWGNPKLPDRLGALVRCVQGCHDAAVHYGMPFISGKDSLNNEWRDAAGVSHPIPGTLLISAVGIVPDAANT
ncbi:MAG: phosphoribosylformylglycinamidine synthase II [Myxococcota bacterium]|jgi:phosphoribosylformylglycinamidine synthase II